MENPKVTLAVFAPGSINLSGGTFSYFMIGNIYDLPNFFYLLRQDYERYLPQAYEQIFKIVEPVENNLVVFLALCM